MHLGMIGLGRMGANLARRLTRGGHQCVVFDVNADAVKGLVGEGMAGATTIEDLVGMLPQPRAVWVMLPAGFVGQTIETLAQHLAPGDIIIDGGNSYYRDDLAHAAMLEAKGIHFVDCGTSGGVFGLERGYCLMVGSEQQTFDYLEPIFRTLAPGPDGVPRTPGRSGDPDAAEHGYLHCGPVGAGHFVKMVHNGIEYGLMAAFAEGLNILHNANIGKRSHEVDAETAPMRNPEHYAYDFDIAAITEVWRRGSVVSSWLLDLTATALVENPALTGFSGRVSDSGEGRWTALAAIEEGVPAPVINAALFERFSSRGNAEYAGKILSAMRRQFGGHVEKKGDQDA